MNLLFAILLLAAVELPVSLADDATDCGPALIALLANDREVHIPPADMPYLFLGGVRLPSGTTLTGDGTRIRHNARLAGEGNKLFVIRDASDVRIAGLDIDGDSGVRVAIQLRGVCERITIEDCRFHDHLNSTIEYGDTLTDPALARLESLALRRLAIDGDCGLTGVGAGINLFPRSQVGSLPASRTVVIEDCTIDVSRGQPNENQHGPQCIKLNNLSGAKLSRLTLRGGHVACLVVSNGCRNVEIATVEASFANNGLWLSDGHNTATTLLGRITWDDFSFRRDGVAGAAGAALVVDAEGTLQGVRE